ncbi:coagulation factor X-like [Anopheles moucheti]|uniref:coagulation factor X-like n=1 Tax=Anopheles moucheti TaxID=186751 RepID=UPI0022F10B4A|nr:coagulation factor X-like [Anopheles moucheti]
MAKIVRNFVLLLCGTVIGCWAQTDNIERPLVRGEYPSIVYVSTPRDQQCIGVVINAHHVLTSATCVMTNQAASIYPARLVQVFGGDLEATSPTNNRQTRTAQHIFVHEHFRVRQNDNNAAIIRLAEPFHLPSNAIEEAQIRMRIVPQAHQCDVVRVEAAGNRLLQAYGVTISNRNLCDSCCLQLFTQDASLCTENITNESLNLLQGDAMFCDGELTALGAFTVTGTTTRFFHFTQVRYLTHWINEQLNRENPMPVGWNPNEF